MATVEKNQTGGNPMTDTDKRIWDDIDWADKNEEIQRKYGGEWVAIRDRKIVAHGMDRDVVVNEAVAATNRPEEEIAVWSIMSPEDWVKSFLTDFPRDEDRLHLADELLAEIDSVAVDCEGDLDSAELIRRIREERIEQICPGTPRRTCK